VGSPKPKSIEVFIQLNEVALASAVQCVMQRTKEISLPVLRYFLIVGPALACLLFYAHSEMAPAALPFSVSQKVGLPEPFKPPVIVAEHPRPVIVAPTVEAAIKVKKSVKAVRKHKAAQVVRRSIAQGRYAAYPAREPGSLW
jgi:hypothetical protein